jgi:Domain of unknown function (DUF1772)
MSLIAEILPFVSAAFLGLFVGALFTEAVVLVPMWRTLDPHEFFRLHKLHAHRLYSFFAPLTVCATLAALASALASILVHRTFISASVLTAIFALTILSTYFLYFQRANASFADGSLTHEALPRELARWAAWHWFRTVVGFFALASSLVALYSGV